MATYHLPHGSNAKGGDAMPTLYLMNPTYAAAAAAPSGGYADNSPTNTNNNMALAAAGSNSRQPPPPPPPQYGAAALCNLLPATQSHIATLAAAEAYGSISGGGGGGSGGGYGWNNGEFLFIPSTTEMRDEQNPSVAAPRHGGGAASHHLDLRNTATPFNDQLNFYSNGAGMADPAAAAGGGGQILSLSLSPQPSLLSHLQPFPMQQLELGMKTVHGHSFSAADMGYATAIEKGDQKFGDMQTWMLPQESPAASGFQHHVSSAVNRHVTPKINIYSSKYLKPAQDLLCEVASNRTEIQSRTAPQETWNGVAAAAASDSFAITGNQAVAAAERNGIPMMSRSWTSEAAAGNGGMVIRQQNAATEVASAAAGAGGGGGDAGGIRQQELQMKRARLESMVEEVEERYRQYRYQMRAVVVSFETAAGVGSARGYTELALRTVSTHFRSLKDAIMAQLRAVRAALGEAEEEEKGGTAAGTGRLRFLEQQMRQHRTLQQLGILQPQPQPQPQQHPWRPQRGLPERSVSVLRAWLFEHFLHPYPKDSDKVLLARQTGLTRNQVSNWFINARVRLWKPMVEEMYTDEMKDAAADVDSEPPPPPPPLRETPDSIGIMSTHNNTAPKSTDMRRSSAAPSSAGFFFHEKKKARGCGGGAQPFMPPDMSCGLGSAFKSEEAEMVAGLRSGEDNNRHYYGDPGEAEGGDERIGGPYGIFRLSGLMSRYSANEAAAAQYVASNGVSLTLGLQNGDGMAAAQTYMAEIRGGAAGMDYYGLPEDGGDGRWRHFTGFSAPP